MISIPGKTAWFARILIVCGSPLVLPGGVFAADAPATTVETTSLTIDLRAQGKPFRGWGTSLAWWANGVGAWPQATVDQIVHLVTDPKEGLGLTVFRYNIGGGDQPGHHHMRHWGDVPGFKASATAPYDWDADAAQRLVLLKLVKAAGKAAIVEAFSNSAPWWMTESGCVAGSKDGGNNLKAEFEDDFADYLAEVARHYRDRHGLTFDTLEPFNEPDANWWKEGKNQEGMHVSHDQQARLIRLVRTALDKRGLRGTLVSAADSNNLDAALDALRFYDAKTLAALGQVNTHSYYGSKRAELRETAAKLRKPVWQSESGPLNVGGTDYEQMMIMAERLVTDINHLRPEVWCVWQVVAGGPWGYLLDEPRERTFRVGKQFHLLASFTRGIRPGDRFVYLDSGRVLAAVSSARREATLVLVNRDKTPRDFRLALQGFPLPVSAAVVSTHATQDFAALDPVNFVGSTLHVSVAPESVTRLTVSLPR